MVQRRRVSLCLLATLFVAGLLVAAGGPAAADPSSSPKTPQQHSALHQRAGAPTCASVHADSSLRGAAPRVCALDPSKLPDGTHAKIAPKLKAQAKSADVQCQLDTLDTDRTTSCVETEDAFEIYDPETLEQLGYGDFSAVSAVGLDVRTRQWTQEIVVTPLFADGLAEAGFVAFATATFPDGPGFTAGLSPDEDVVTLDEPVTFEYPVSSPGTATVAGRVQAVLQIEPLLSEGLPIDYNIGDPPSVRCDSTPGVGPATGGCVYYLFKPTYSVSTLNNDTAQVAWHILWAQRNLLNHWGWQGHGPALTRTRNAALIRANRRAACSNRHPRPGQSCDEYPFASTREGASLNPDYSWHNLNARQNSLEGSRYRRPWYNQNRMLEGDQFWVNVVVPPGADTTKIPGFDS